MSPGSSVVTTVDVVNNFNSSKQHIRSASGTVLTDSIEEILKQVLLVLGGSKAVTMTLSMVKSLSMTRKIWIYAMVMVNIFTI